jgi:glycosyltransferase involved in cell wall biosynthesis
VDPRPFATADGRAFRARLKLATAPIVGYVGRLEPAKGVTCLLAAMERVWRARPDAQLVLAGRRFPAESAPDRAVQAALDALPVECRRRVVLVEGFGEGDKADIFAAMDVFAMPSLVESFGLAYVEAWMCARPVIGADAGAAATVIRHDVDGLLVDARDPDAVAKALECLLGDPARCARLGRAGHARAMSEFTAERAVERAAAICAALVRNRRHAMLASP